MCKAGQEFALEPELFMTLNEVEQRAGLSSRQLAVEQTLACARTGLIVYFEL
jgi:hypothetical protein